MKLYIFEVPDFVHQTEAQSPNRQVGIDEKIKSGNFHFSNYRTPQRKSEAKFMKKTCFFSKLMSSVQLRKFPEICGGAWFSFQVMNLSLCYFRGKNETGVNISGPVKDDMDHWVCEGERENLHLQPTRLPIKPSDRRDFIHVS